MRGKSSSREVKNATVGFPILHFALLKLASMSIAQKLWHYGGHVSLLSRQAGHFVLGLSADSTLADTISRRAYLTAPCDGNPTVMSLVRHQVETNGGQRDTSSGKRITHATEAYDVYISTSAIFDASVYFLGRLRCNYEIALCAHE
eukprot:scaffold95781_cov16-Prasinocladus_malaysianus.AAC.1